MASASGAEDGNPCPGSSAKGAWWSPADEPWFAVFVADEPGIAMAQARSDCWVCWYTKGLPDERRLRTELFQDTSLSEIEGLLERYRAERATTVLS